MVGEEGGGKWVLTFPNPTNYLGSHFNCKNPLKLDNSQLRDVAYSFSVRKITIIHAFKGLSPDQKNACSKSDVPHNQLFLSIQGNIHIMRREILLFKKISGSLKSIAQMT